MWHLINHGLQLCKYPPAHPTLRLQYDLDTVLLIFQPSAHLQLLIDWTHLNQVICSEQGKEMWKTSRATSLEDQDWVNSTPPSQNCVYVCTGFSCTLLVWINKHLCHSYLCRSPVLSHHSRYTSANLITYYPVRITTEVMSERHDSVPLTWPTLAYQSQSNATILTSECWESPAASYTQHIQPQHTVRREENNTTYKVRTQTDRQTRELLTELKLSQTDLLGSCCSSGKSPSTGCSSNWWREAFCWTQYSIYYIHINTRIKCQCIIYYS